MQPPHSGLISCNILIIFLVQLYLSSFLLGVCPSKTLFFLVLDRLDKDQNTCHCYSGLHQIDLPSLTVLLTTFSRTETGKSPTVAQTNKNTVQQGLDQLPGQCSCCRFSLFVSGESIVSRKVNEVKSLPKRTLDRICTRLEILSFLRISKMLVFQSTFFFSKLPYRDTDIHLQTKI